MIGVSTLHEHGGNLNSLPQLPAGWRWATIGEVTRNFVGKRVPIKAGDRDARPGQYPYYGASGVIDDIDDFLFDGEFLLIAEDGANLLSRSTPIAFRASGKFWVNNHAHVVQTADGMPLQYLEWYLNGTNLQFFITGSAQPKLNQLNLNRIPVPVAPLPEQQRIVSKIEELFSDLDAGVSALERAKANLKRYRASVLKAAVEGRLTADWRAANPNVEPATELLHRILTTRRQTWEANQLAEYERKGKKPPAGWKGKYIEPVSPENTPDARLPNGWCWATVDQLAIVGTGITPKRSERRFYDGGTIPWVTSTAVNERNVYAGNEHVTEIARVGRSTCLLRLDQKCNSSINLSYASRSSRGDTKIRSQSAATSSMRSFLL